MFSCLYNSLTCLHLEKVGKENRGINTRSRILRNADKWVPDYFCYYIDNIGLFDQMFCS